MPASSVKTVIYGLCDKEGAVFYVGKTRNLKKRMTAYKSSNFHGNRKLGEMIKKNGVRYVILREVEYDSTQAEFEEISKLSGLVNIIKDPRLPFLSGGQKDWTVNGTKHPTALYKNTMRIRFGDSCQWLDDALKNMDTKKRLDIEMKFAEFLLTTSVKA